jgi:hypothetical protein
MITIDRRHPTFVAKAVGVLTGQLIPKPDGRTATILCVDSGTQVMIPATLHDRAIEQLMADPSLFGKKLDLLVWPRTCPHDLEVIVITLEAAVPNNPDRDHFLIQGMALRMKPNSKMVKIGIRNNSSDRNNTSRFERFWLSLHGHLRGNHVNTIYQVKAVRKGSRLFIIDSSPHIKTGKRWKLIKAESGLLTDSVR